jgi:hypothetical protein
MRSILAFALGYMFVGLLSVSAQTEQPTTTTSDPYSDYSHLWDDDAGKKKKNKSKNEPAQTNPQPAIVAQDTIPDQQQLQPTDSTQTDQQEQAPEQTPTEINVPDSTQQQPIESISQTDTIPDEPLEMVTDTIPDQTPMVQDTIPQEPEQPQIEPEEQPTQEVEETPEVQEETSVEKEKKTKEKKEKKGFSFSDIEPVQGDFRGSSGGDAGGGTINGGVTFTVIDDQYYAGMTLQPEFSIWKIGVGLNVPILFNIQDQTFRKEIYQDGVGLARMITYLRFGKQKQDPIYVRVGELNGIMIGFGGLVNNYTNSTSFEKRKVGLHYDVNFKGLIGLEGMYSDFDPTSSNLMVTRPYIRPLGFLSVPVVRTLEIGASFVKDRDQTAIPLSDSTFTSYNFTGGDGISAFGIDAGINLVSIPFINIDAFFNYGRLDLATGGLQDSIDMITPDAGSLLSDGYADGTGSSYGVNFRFNFIADVLKTDVRIERLSYTEHYLPQFFDFSYELNKDARIFATTVAEQKSGIYGSLTGHILQTIQLGGSLMIPDQISEETPAVVQVNANAERVADKFSLQGTYLKGNLADLADAFKLDERSITKVRFIYHMNKFLAVGLDYYWAFTPVGDGSYKATKYVSPYFGLSIKL